MELLKHHCANHCNISMKNRKSELGITFRYLAFKYKIKSNYWHEDWKHIERCIFTNA